MLGWCNTATSSLRGVTSFFSRGTAGLPYFGGVAGGSSRFFGSVSHASGVRTLFESSGFSSKPTTPTLLSNATSLSSTTRTTTCSILEVSRFFAKKDAAPKLTGAQKAAQKAAQLKRKERRLARIAAKQKEKLKRKKKEKVWEGPKFLKDLPPRNPLRREKPKPVVAYAEVPERQPRDPIVGTNPLQLQSPTFYKKQKRRDFDFDALNRRNVLTDMYGPINIQYGVAVRYQTRFVYQGNTLSPAHTITPPTVQWDMLHSQFYTMALVDLDAPGPIDPHASPFVHWLCVNMTTKNRAGDTIVEYIPAIPTQNTGKHRYVFVVFSQNNGAIPLEVFTKVSKNNLAQRNNFNLLKTSRKLHLTPESVAYFRAQWDETVSKFYAEAGVKEPSYVVEDLTPAKVVSPARTWL